ncbi:MAG: hypothetical protein M5U19_01870 [Microthrixaceae bacterium]|nr:hypothetical protein [Microthrixaceae bacterium]
MFRVTAATVAAAALLAVGFALLVRAALPTDERNAVIINLAVFCINGTLVALVFRFLDRAPPSVPGPRLDGRTDRRFGGGGRAHRTPVERRRIRSSCWRGLACREGLPGSDLGDWLRA